MKIKYKITEYFEKNSLFDNQSGNGLTIKKDNDSLVIKGGTRDLVEFADLIVNIALEKQESHINIDDLNLLNKDSDF